MRTYRIIMIAWGVAAAALLAWGGVVVFNGSFRAALASREALIASTQQLAARESGAIRLHMLARDTKGARDQLGALTQTDVLSIANMVEDIGKATGAKVKIGDVLSGPAAQAPAAPNAILLADASGLNDVVFLVEADGSFPSLMRAIIMLEQLPLLSSVQDLELRRTSSTAGGTWHAAIHVHALSATLIPT